MSAEFIKSFYACSAELFMIYFVSSRWLVSISGVNISILIAVLHYYRAARRATTGALALPIPLLPENQIPLHVEPEHPVPMLSVQSAGCAGMERLGVPTRTTLNAPPDDRGHISRRIRMDTCDLLVRDAALLSDRQMRNNNHYHRVGCGMNGSSYSLSNSSNIRVGIDAAAVMTAQQQTVASKLKPINNDNHQQQQMQQQNIRCPHHVPLPDSEWGQDRDLQIRTRYQQSEITRSYIKPPPNKTVLDVPEQSYNFYPTTMLSSTPSVATSGISCNLRANLANQHSSYNNHHNYHHLQQQQQSCSSGFQQPQHHQQTAILTQQQHKSKPNVITKLFSRKSSPKSPTALCPSSSMSSNGSLSSSTSSSSSLSSSSPSSSSVSTSSSSSSLCSAQILPISTAATLTATTCSLGPAAPIQNNQTPTNNSSNITSNSTFLPAIGANRGSPSPPLAVKVPVAATNLPQQQQQQQQFHSQQRHQQHQQLLLADSTNSSNLSSTSLHLLKSSSCNLSSTYNTSPCSSPSFTNVAANSLDIPSTSIDCCYGQATSIQRSRSSSATSPSSTASQQQQSIDNNCGSSNSSSNSSINSISSMSSSRNYQHHI